MVKTHVIGGLPFCRSAFVPFCLWHRREGAKAERQKGRKAERQSAFLPFCLCAFVTVDGADVVIFDFDVLPPWIFGGLEKPTMGGLPAPINSDLDSNRRIGWRDPC